MVAVFDRPAPVPCLPAHRAWRWCLDGLRLWRRFPLRLFLLSLLPMLLEGALQTIPVVGMVLSKILPLLLGFGLWRGLAESEATGVLRWSCLFDLCRAGSILPALGLAAIQGPVVFVVQLAGAMAVHGWPVVDAVVLGNVAAHRELVTRSFACLLILPGVPVAVLLGLAPMYLLFRGASPWQALRCSVRNVWRSRAAFGVFALVQLVLLGGAVGLPFGMVLLLPLLPWMCACAYMAWKDVDGAFPA